MSIFYNRDSALIEAFNSSQAMIEFTPDGQILTANANFLKVVGYSLSEVVGRHHRIFCAPDYVQTPDYASFWRALASGQFRADEFKRFTRSGQAVWLQASYNPVFGRDGKVARVVKIAADTTVAKQKALDDAGKINAIYLSQAVIEFSPDGEILTANDNFLKAVGYQLDEIKGRHHQMFCEPEFVRSPDYETLWRELAKGHFIAGEYKRIGKEGHEVFIQAAYNPIFDDTGKVVKVVKFAVDMSDLIKKRMLNDGIGHEINSDLGNVLNQINHANQLAKSASKASNETGSIISSVAAASEELTLSVREISHNMGSAQSSVENVFKYAESANQSANGLNDSAVSMNNVVAIIQDIASQINLLALNATIESARAGDAGKGFAVVASEVKNLANQAAQSTKTIASEITNMQVVSNGVVESLGLISRHMSLVMDNVASVATSIDQQNTVTHEISANMQTAVSAVQEIENSLGHITTTFSTVADASEHVKERVETLVA